MPTAMINSMIFALIFLCVGSAKELVNVTIGCGLQLQGYHVNFGNNKNGLYHGKADVFLGIPYAEPPTGRRRFSRPQPHNCSNMADTPYNATYLRSICPQPYAHPSLISEDCLFLNVYSPDVASHFKYPVMVWIHGGALQLGSARQFHTDGVIANLVSRGVVVVTVQYRLGMLGFFTTFSEDFPPNLGMLDQVEALLWVSNEIMNFGGDPYRVTLFGQSAGAASVSAHTFSPLSSGLFHQAIMQSGSIFISLDGELGHSANSKEQAHNLCNITLPTTTSTAKQLKRCLMSINITKILSFDKRVFGWKMVVDGDFLPKSPEELKLERPNIPVIYGITKDEMTFKELFPMKQNRSLESYNRNYFERSLREVTDFYGYDSLKMIEAVYAQSVDDDDYVGWFKATSDALSAVTFIAPIVKEIEWYLQNGNPNVYVYELIYAPSTQQSHDFEGYEPVPHGSELSFIFMLPEAMKSTTGTDNRMIDFFGSTWTNFAKHASEGEPSFVHRIWQPANDENKISYLEIGRELVMESGFREVDSIFWNHVMPTLRDEWPERQNVTAKL